MPQTWEDWAFMISGSFALAASCGSAYLIYKHLRNWTKPSEQKWIVRLLIMVPVYAADSWFSIRYRHAAIYLDTIRDCYEAYVLYSFFSLLLAYVGGDDDRDVGEVLAGKAPIKHPPPLCCLPLIKPGPYFLLRCKQFILQYVVVKPVLAIVAVIMSACDVYHEGHFTVTSGYAWVTIIANVSVTLAVYWLVLFYFAAKEELKPHKPIGKFVCIKAILFFSFWQGIVIGLLAYFEVVTAVGDWQKTEITTGLQDFVLTIEMFGLAAWHLWTFSYQEYKDYETFVPWQQWKSVKDVVPVFRNFREVMSTKEVRQDIKESFNPKVAKTTRDVERRLLDEERVEKDK